MMAAQIALNADTSSTVDATRPFSSVKEAVAIFGERLFLGAAPSFITGKEISRTFELPESSDRPSSVDTHSTMDGEEVTDPSFDEPTNPAELTSPEVLLNSSDEQAVDLSLSKPSQLGHTSDKLSNPAGLESPLKPPTMAFNQASNSPMYKLTPSPQNPQTESHGNIVHGNDLVMMLMVLKKLETELQETKMELKLLKERESQTEVAVASLNAELHNNMSKIAKAEAAEAARAASKSITNNEGVNRDIEPKNEDRARGETMMKTIDSPTLAQILSISDYEGYFRGNRARTKKMMKKKPIIPLVTDLFLWKKKSSPAHDISTPIISSQMYFA